MLRFAAVVAFGGLLVGGCGPTDPVETGPPPSIVLISLDTLRADHLSLYGYERPTSPNLIEFARTATLYERAHTTAPWTLPSHGSMFTGLYPFEHGARTYDKSQIPEARKYTNTIPLPSQHRTLAEALRDYGYTTAGVAANKAFLTEKFGLHQGFDYWDNDDGRWWEINERVAGWLDSAPQEPFFLFINYMDTHRPYNNKRRDDIPYVHPSEAKLNQVIPKILNQEDVPAEALQRLTDVYDTSIANLDEGLGALFADLRQRGLFDDTLIVITSDHGEFLGEHQLAEHSKDVYQGVSHVPLVVKAPGQETAEVDTDLVSLVHIPGIVLSHIPELRDAERFPDPERDAVLTENFGPRPRTVRDAAWRARFERVRRGLIRENYKFVDSSDGHDELYDLFADPTELVDLHAKHPELAAELQALMDSRFGDIVTPEEVNAVELSEEELETMRQLGYAGDDEPAPDDASEQ